MFIFHLKQIKYIIFNVEQFLSIASIAMFTCTYNFVERLFSRAKLALDDQRKRVLPMQFELEVFLFANKRLWNIKNVDNVVAKIG